MQVNNLISEGRWQGNVCTGAKDDERLCAARNHSIPGELHIRCDFYDESITNYSQSKKHS
jgi:hypothetical protein